MSQLPRRYGPEDVGLRGCDIFERVVRPTLTPEDFNKVVAIDVVSENYEMDHKDGLAITRLQGRCPDAQLWLMRVGRPGSTILIGVPRRLQEIGGMWECGGGGQPLRHSFEEFKRRGTEIYERVIRPTLKPEDDSKLVVIDIESENYEIDENHSAAEGRLRARCPNAQTWLVRVGHIAPYRMSYRMMFRGGE